MFRLRGKYCLGIIVTLNRDALVPYDAKFGMDYFTAAATSGCIAIPIHIVHSDGRRGV